MGVSEGSRKRLCDHPSLAFLEIPRVAFLHLCMLHFAYESSRHCSCRVQLGRYETYDYYLMERSMFVRTSPMDKASIDRLVELAALLWFL